MSILPCKGRMRDKNSSSENGCLESQYWLCQMFRRISEFEAGISTMAFVERCVLNYGYTALYSRTPDDEHCTAEHLMMNTVQQDT